MLTVQKEGKGYRLGGVIDEDADLSTIPDEDLELDLSGVDRINSMGLLVWKTWKEGRTHRVTLKNLPVSFVAALACVGGLAEGMRVRSVRAPFVDAESGATEEIVLEAATLARIVRTGDCPPMVSPGTSRSIRLDEDPAQYFAFLRVPHGPRLVDAED